jgi:hypothetical protein
MSKFINMGHNKPTQLQFTSYEKTGYESVDRNALRRRIGKQAFDLWETLYTSVQDHSKGDTSVCLETAWRKTSSGKNGNMSNAWRAAQNLRDLGLLSRASWKRNQVNLWRHQRTVKGNPGGFRRIQGWHESELPAVIPARTAEYLKKPGSGRGGKRPGAGRPKGIHTSHSLLHGEFKPASMNTLQRIQTSEPKKSFLSYSLSNSSKEEYPRSKATLGALFNLCKREQFNKPDITYKMNSTHPSTILGSSKEEDEFTVLVDNCGAKQSQVWRPHTSALLYGVPTQGVPSVNIPDSVMAKIPSPPELAPDASEERNRALLMSWYRGAYTHVYDKVCYAYCRGPKTWEKFNSLLDAAAPVFIKYGIRPASWCLWRMYAWQELQEKAKSKRKGYPPLAFFFKPESITKYEGWFRHEFRNGKNYMGAGTPIYSEASVVFVKSVHKLMKHLETVPEGNDDEARQVTNKILPMGRYLRLLEAAQRETLEINDDFRIRVQAGGWVWDSKVEAKKHGDLYSEYRK